MNTYYVLSVGLYEPHLFKWGRTTPLLTQGDLWEAARSVPPCLLMRVRSDSEPNEGVTTKDEPESVIGIIDPTVRWRSALAMATAPLVGIRSNALADACWKALGLFQRHPANIMGAERQAAIAGIKEAMEGLNTQSAAAMFEGAIAHNLCQFVMADNDYEAAQATPFETPHMLNIDARDKAMVDRRSATLEALSGGVVLGEAYRRLMERLPVWHYAPVPDIMLPGAEASPSEPHRPASRPAVVRSAPRSPADEEAEDGEASPEPNLDEPPEPVYSKTTHAQRSAKG